MFLLFFSNFANNRHYENETDKSDYRSYCPSPTVILLKEITYCFIIGVPQFALSNDITSYAQAYDQDDSTYSRTPAMHRVYPRRFERPESSSIVALWRALTTQKDSWKLVLKLYHLDM
jgi:hypothetical protein